MEIEQRTAGTERIQIQSVYWGGGTPNLLHAGQVERVMEKIRQRFSWSEPWEVTMELNPAADQHMQLRNLADAGINRFSVGVQSFFDDDLSRLGRSHTARMAFQVIEDLHRLNLRNFNLDFIFGLPGQTVKRWDQNLRWAVESEPAHLSAYLLQLSEQVPMQQWVDRQEISLPDDDTAADLYQLAQDLLPAQRFCQYEISNFACRGKECRHNLLYWNAGDYWGFGAGAVSLTNRVRWQNLCDVDAYIHNLLSGKKPDMMVLETMNSREQWAEALILGLRLCAGINIKAFENRFHIDLFEAYGHTIEKYIKLGLLHADRHRIYLDPKAYFISNGILADFI